MRIAIATLFLLLLGMLVACTPGSEIKPIGAAIDPPHPINNVVLLNQDGVPWGVGNLRDRVVLMAFAYTHCPDICPLTMADFRRVKTALGDDAKQVEFVFVSVDGKRDTPPVIKQYLLAFDPGFVGLTGDESFVKQLADQFGARFQAEAPKSGATSYAVAHTSYMYALDKQGRWRITFVYQSDPEQVAATLRPLINEPVTVGNNSAAETFGNIYAGIPAKPIIMDAPSVLPDIALTSQLDKSVRFADFQGKYTLLFFGATHCTADCRNLWPQFRTVKQALGVDADKVQFAMVSVDGERDSPAVLRAYMQPYDPSFLALTGPLDVVAPFAIKHGIHVTIDPTSNPRQAEPHPVYSILLDRTGRWIVAFPYSMGPEALAEALRSIMRGS